MKETAKQSSQLPIVEVIPEILSSLESHLRLVLEAPPGAGKTTQVPLALLNAPWCAGKKILMLEPRRVAARAAATFMAQSIGEKVGQSVGYRIRFENLTSSSTRVEVVTEGILTRMIQDDPLLDNVGAILFDEFHERHLAGDLGLALALDVQNSVREDLRIVVMSATLDGENLSNFLQARRITSAGRAFPVSTTYFPAKRDEALSVQIKRCLLSAIVEQEGDALIFLPGQREIKDLAAALAIPSFNAYDIISLYGEMPIEQQSAALVPDPNGKPRIVLASNIAESSVTLPGVRIVIDSGLAREPRFDPNSGFSRLQTVYISQASADQRSGRAGRVAAGACYRLWPKEQRMESARKPEINNVDLAALVLELAAWGNSRLSFIDAPPSGTMAAASELLKSLNALDAKGSITPLGKKMLALGTHPRLAAMLLSVHDDTQKSLACDLAALIEARDPLTTYRRDDWFSRWQALADRRSRSSTANISGVSRAAISAIMQASTQWHRRVFCKTLINVANSHQLGNILAHAFPDRIAHVHPSNPLRYQLSNGRMARIHEESQLAGEPWLAVSELRFDSKDSLILRASPLDETCLREDFAQGFVEEEVVRWDDKTRALLSRHEQRFEQIILSSKPGGKVDADQAALALSNAVGEYGLACLPWTEKLQQWRKRVLCLREWMPELNLPDLSDAALLATRKDWLMPAFNGLRKIDALREEALHNALTSLLDWPMQQALEKEAPTRMLVPSGLERQITYEADSSPILAVKLQELFGLASTPRIASARIPLTLHLLSPGGKPLQITQDLQSFWANTYPEVKKEMKGRYPKHPWPDDPWSATATHRAKPRK